MYAFSSGETVAITRYRDSFLQIDAKFFSRLSDIMKSLILAFVLLFSSLLNASSWPQWSGDLLNHHNLTPERPLLSRNNVSQLKPVWKASVRTSVIATPTVTDGKVYFTDIAKIGAEGLFDGGRLYAADATTGKVLWKTDVGTYTGAGIRNFSRSSPAIDGDLLVIGDSLNNMKFLVRMLTNRTKIPGTALIAVNRHNGKLVWKTIIEDHFASRITMSPVIYEGKVFVGVSSIESEIPGVRGESYKCCGFKGSFVAVDLKSGKLLWKTPMISGTGSDNSGAPVWGSSPPIDVKRKRIYIGTGNNYHVTKAFRTCYKKGMTSSPGQEELVVRICAEKYDSPENRFDSLVALDMNSGKIIWTRKTNIYDSWNVGCGSKFSQLPRRNEKICPKPEGADGDFAQAPMLITNTKGEDILVAGQKNGMFWAVRAEDGEVLWKKQVGPGGKLGGHQWGSATDGKLVYYQTTNLEHKEIVLEAGLEKGRKIYGGLWGAIVLETGEIVWETADPDTSYPLKGEGINHWIYGMNLGRGFFAAPMGPLTYYNEMIFAGSFSGLMVALDAHNGKVLWTHRAKGSVVGAPSIVNDQLFWGSGYHLGVQDNTLWSFGL